MRTMRLSVLAAAMVLAGVGANANAEEPVSENALVGGNTEFAIALHQRLAEDGGNLVASPFSISSALAMTYAGAGGETAAQMEEVLRFAGEDVHEVFAAVVGELREREAEEDYELVVANALWGQEGYDFAPAFLELLEMQYEAPLREADFAGEPEAEADRINAWVEEQTQERIQDIIPPGTLNPLTRLVLANAIYFKGAWLEPFEEEATEAGEFTRADGEVVDVDMMRQTEQFRYAEVDGVQVLELPYEGRDVAMLVALPETHDGLAALEAELTADTVEQWVDALSQEQVDVRLPKFEFTTELRLDDVLQAMGMEHAFSPRDSDFSGMAPDADDLHISAVLHKAFIDVHEEGTEAAAATAVVMQVTAIMPEDEPVAFHADRPFLFLLRDQHSGSILFMGRAADPSA
ncbi:MAG: serpin family protein [Candidatus Hydrogenedentota bacterium]